LVIATEKVHGSQCALLVDEAGVPHVSSKGFFDKGIEIREGEGNIYWRAVRNTGLVDLLVAAFPGRLVQAFGEAFPAQGGQWSYGADGDHPAIRVFRVIVDGRELSMEEAKAAIPEIADLWVPVLYEGRFDLDVLRPLAKGREQVSGRARHKREGLVVTPATPRRAREGFNLALKIVSPDFKDSDDALP
jgi:RNA ligase (TIGR02306 family)